MKHKNLIPILFLFAVSTLTGGCTGNDDNDPARIPEATLSARVTADGFAAEGDGGSRTTETGYATTFAVNDAIGMFVKKADGTFYANNLKVTRQADGSWKPAIRYVAGATCYAYYPHRDDMTGKADVAAIIAALPAPGTNQSNAALYTDADAMTATGTPDLTTGTLSLAFTHAHALVEITLPAGASDIAFDGIHPFALNGKWRYLAAPGSTVTLNGYYNREGHRYTIPVTTVTVPATAGQYKTVTVTEGK